MGHKERIEAPGGEVLGPYSPGVKSYGVVWLSGQIAVDAGDDVSSQTAGALAKVEALLAAANLSRDDICFVQVLLDDINDFQTMNDIYADWFSGVEILPARAAFAAAALPAGALVEIVVQAIDSTCE